MTLITRLPLTIGDGAFPKLSDFGVLPQDGLAALYDFEGATFADALVDRSPSGLDATPGDNWTYADGIATAEFDAGTILTGFTPASGNYTYAVLARSLDDTVRNIARAMNIRWLVTLQTAPSLNSARTVYFDAAGTQQAHLFGNVLAGTWTLHLVTVDHLAGSFSYQSNALEMQTVALVTAQTEFVPDGSPSGSMVLGGTDASNTSRHDVAFFAGWQRSFTQLDADALYNAVRRWAGDVKGITLPNL